MTSRFSFPSVAVAVAFVLLVGSSCGPDDTAPAPVVEATPRLEIEAVGFGVGGIALDYDAEYVGSRRCATCHVDHSKLMRDHPMALTARLITVENRDDWFSAEHLDKPVRWPPGEPSSPIGYQRDDASVYLESAADDGTMLRAEATALFGSGRHGFTPIAVADDRRIRELRTSFFSAQDEWIMTPGLAGLGDAVGLVHTPGTSSLCLGCHATVLAWDGDRLDPQASTFGIGCERCHGPGGAHIDVIAKTADGDPKIYNPGALTTHGLVEFCGQCHRVAADVEAHEVLARAPVLVRHAGAGLTLSACFRKSPATDSIGCLDCHDPHHAEEPFEAAQQTCLRCHADSGAQHFTTEVTDASDCVSCHMPVDSKGFFGMSFTEHWIRVPGTPPPGETDERDEYVRYLETSYIDAVTKRTLHPESSSRLRMYLVDHLIAEDKRDEALPWLEEVLMFEPRYSHRLIAAREFYFAGRKDAAVDALEGAITVDPAVNHAYYKLFRIYLEDGEFDAAEAVIARWAAAIPDDVTVWQAREELSLKRTE